MNLPVSLPIILLQYLVHNRPAYLQLSLQYNHPFNPLLVQLVCLPLSRVLSHHLNLLRSHLLPHRHNPLYSPPASQHASHLHCHLDNRRQIRRDNRPVNPLAAQPLSRQGSHPRYRLESPPRYRLDSPPASQHASQHASHLDNRRQIRPDNRPVHRLSYQVVNPALLLHRIQQHNRAFPQQLNPVANLPNNLLVRPLRCPLVNRHNSHPNNRHLCQLCNPALNSQPSQLCNPHCNRLVNLLICQARNLQGNHRVYLLPHPRVNRQLIPPHSQLAFPAFNRLQNRHRNRPH